MKTLLAKIDPPEGLMATGPVVYVNFTPTQQAMEAIVAGGGTVQGAGNAMMMIDTGASRTMLDERLCAGLGIVPVSYAKVEGVDGKPIPRPVYRVLLHLQLEAPSQAKPKGDGISLELEVFGMPTSERGERHIAGLLGRDFLSLMEFRYDGPTGTYALRLSGPAAQAAAARPAPRGFLPQAAAGRNEQCPCGSGKKYKKCCGAPN